MSSEPLMPIRRWVCDRCKRTLELPEHTLPEGWWKGRVDRARRLIDEVDWCAPCGAEVVKHFRQVKL